MRCEPVLVFFELSAIESIKWTKMADTLRSGVKTLIRGSLVKGGIEVPRSALVESLEQACHDAAQAADNPRGHYAALYSGLCKALPAPYGDFLEAPLALWLKEGKMSVDEVITPKVYKAHLSIDPRKRCSSLFYAILAQDARFDENKRRDFAARIERGCYNATIQQCTNSDDSYQRHWENDMFVNVYSGRCGLVSANIDPTGTVALSVGGTWALDRLAAEEWQPEALGAMTENELCPQAGKAERDVVAHRLNQKVDEKTSTLFACPRCHKRNHTYRQVQIGAGDEPSTFMCTCKECGENYEGRA